MGFTRSSLVISCVASLMSGASAAITSGKACTPSSTTLKMKWNAYASEWGAYTIDGCDGVNPKLTLAAGTTYTFDQSDASNWYHPVGFAYIAGGAHTECKQDQAGNLDECPELGGETPATTIQYYVDGVARTDDESGFGLDAYEPLFFYPQGEWVYIDEEAGTTHTYSVELTVPDVTDFYYFCHIHAGMSANIHVKGASANAESPKQHAEFFPEPPMITSQDEACGTVGVFDHAHDLEAACAGKHFLCGDNMDDLFNTCMEAIDCKMHVHMAVHTDADPIKTFMRQMIPHHQNAVSMAKILMKHAPDADDDVKALLREIMAVQNHQIQTMQGYLDGADAQHCYDGDHCPAGCRSAHGMRALLFGVVHAHCPQGCVPA